MSVNSGRLYARLLGGAAVLALSAGIAQAEPANFNIAPQPLSLAVGAFSEQSGRPVLLKPELADKLSSKGVSGSLEPELALAEMLSGTGLTYRKTGDTFLIESADAPQSGSAAGDGAEGTVQALIVTAQKKEEAIQDVPIAISAFTEKSLQEQKIEGGFDLLKAVPNVTFSKNNFSGYNFSIRGIGTKAISVTTDPGVAVEFNNMALIRNRLFEQEYFDVERVEVLRGPQGTLHGRNATSGVINMISAKPNLTEFSGWIKGEVGNYHAKRISAMVNVPLVSDKLAIRVAGALTQRNGFGVNLYDGSDVDNRNLWSARVTVGFNPTDRIKTNLVWERFNEDDNRARTSKQLCTRDPGPAEIGGVPIPYDATNGTVRGDQLYGLARGYYTQGCLPGSLYDKAAFGTPNGMAIPFVYFLENYGLNVSSPQCAVCSFVYPQGVDPYGNQMQSTNLRAIYSMIKPKYRASADTVEFNADVDLTSSLLFSSQTAYVKDKYYATQDFNRFTTYPVFLDSNLIRDPDPRSNSYLPFTPNGVFCDPQLGCSNTIVGQDLSRAKSSQFSQEIRIQSSFSGPLNFSAGVHYTRYKTVEDYYVFFNGITLTSALANASLILGGLNPSKFTTNPDCAATGGGWFGQPDLPDGLLCIPIEQNPISAIQDVGHNYFLSRNPYTLSSAAAFGEVYWQATDDLKWTLGLRYTDDRKTFTPIPSETILTDPARLQPYASLLGQEFIDRLSVDQLYGFGHGYYPALPDVKRSWKEVTGRFGFDWKPKLTFTDQTMIYGFYSRGYKGGGMNPPRIGLNYDGLAAIGIILAPSAPPEFKPEFVNAFELGAKNTLLGGAMVFNTDAFFYDYQGYQVSKIVERTANNENFDARIWGLEFETLFRPTRNLRLNANLGYLDTKLGKGSRSIDVMNRTAGHTDWVVVKPAVTLSSNCIVPTRVASQILGVLGAISPGTVEAACPGGGFQGDSFTGRPGPFTGPQTLPDGTNYDPADYPEANYGAGFYTDVSGRELPNSPHLTANVGAQYSRDFLDHWKATVRADGYWQSQSWARVYELPIDKLHGWYNANLSVWVENDDGLKVEFYAKNILDGTPITDTFTNSDDTALTTNVFTLDPRLIGLSIKKDF